jgi:hypothetical protein
MIHKYRINQLLCMGLRLNRARRGQRNPAKNAAWDAAAMC